MGKQPLVLLPGTLCNEKLWAHQARCLSDIADITVGDLSQNDTIEEMAQSVLQQAPSSFALAGLSMGGIVALQIMRMAPKRVSHLALLDTSPYPPTLDQINTWEKFIEMADTGQFLEVTTNYLLPGLIRSESRKDKSLVSTIVEMAEETGKEAMVRQMKALMKKPDGRAILPKINCPTLVLHGREDTICSAEAHQEMADAIPSAALVAVEEAGHLSTLEQSQAVTALLRFWLQQ
ncbi:pimeloyl-ACP methyl ester carboxylesterase [Scopulibacillus darangshiensis]|uniref:Pimeloyl-ACP methyl ester carboxylesterase n=1 Tax=Scopulibacillus darangshiensis TaxID=442528 RepID=A0A4R2P7R7_9BACL|nr:alpha/beta hydrolase [Scopulibacillus darangshiensis]TCP30942.1 pimeloyl-ACP methyl ester carboxylesterase [Scopulibacillus darangshiensis]